MLAHSSKNMAAIIPTLVALLSAVTVSLVHSRAEARQGRSGWRWRVAAHGLLGLALWTTHAAGLMIASHAPQYHLSRHSWLCALALVLSVLTPIFCLRPLRVQLPPSRWELYLRALSLACGISLAHCLDLIATDFQVYFDPHTLAVLATINLLASVVICQIYLTPPASGQHSSLSRVSTIALLGLSMVALHDGSMAPAMIYAHLPPQTLRELLSSQRVSIVASLLALAVLSGAGCSAWLDARRSRNTARLVDRLTEANRALNRLAYHDPLTQLPNRSLFEDKLGAAIERARSEASSLMILFIDLDGFKAINKAFGHQQGDRLLTYVAQQIQSAIPRRHPVARTSGDEFIVLLDLNSTEAAIRIGSQILQAISQPIQIEEHPLSLTASLGIAQYPHDGTSPRELIEHANMAMYQAKNGQQSYAIFEPTMHAMARDHLLLLSDLRQALSQQQLILHYQPIMHAPNGPMAAAEVLIRWQHPQRGLLLPETFIGIAERAGLIVDIGNWVIDAACQQLRQWSDQGADEMRLAINVSAIQLHYDLLLDTLRAATQRHRIEPARLTLEFTESAAMKDPARSLEILRHLRELGFKISLDDFGTGYSSLLYLKQLPASELKIDRCFVREIDQLEHDRTIVAAIIALARQLHMSIVAEGVETPRQKAILCELGCTFLQGYLWGTPVPAAQLEVPRAISHDT